MSYLGYLCLFEYSGVQFILFFALLFFVYVACFSILFIVITPSVFSNVYFKRPRF
jgi:hypothetical protein